MPFASYYQDFSAAPPAPRDIVVVPYRQGRNALWILNYAGGGGAVIYTDPRGNEALAGNNALGITLNQGVPFRISRALDGSMVDGPWYVDQTRPFPLFQYWESWDDTAMNPSQDDAVAKGEIMIPHAIVSTILDKLRGK